VHKVTRTAQKWQSDLTKSLERFVAVCQSVVVLLEYLSNEWWHLGALFIAPSGLGAIASFLRKLQI
jgi:hypothetical protein